MPRRLQVHLLAAAACGTEDADRDAFTHALPARAYHGCAADDAADPRACIPLKGDTGFAVARRASRG
jgi:hypothetical protein